MEALYGDIHNHCGISYGHGSLADALANARERLDFVSITGHAHWPDMPAPTPRFQPIIDFHLEGFAKLKKHWPAMMAALREANREGEFIVFPAFEIHSCAHGDRNVLYRDLAGEILYPDSIPHLHAILGALRARGIETLCQPHHIGYRKGTRGIDWSSHRSDFEPLVELISMHGCSEASETPRPFLHVMGPSDFEGTIHQGLRRGHVFGVTGGTDHHSAHPGSYGHGLTGVWAERCSREAIWEAFYARRTWAMTGDRIELDFQVDGNPMGSVVAPGENRNVRIAVRGGGAIDAVDVVKNGRLIWRQTPVLADTTVEEEEDGMIHTQLHLDLGWGPRGARFDWDVALGISEGEILGVEPRFRGLEVVSPLEGQVDESTRFESRVTGRNDRFVEFVTVTRGNPNNSTNASQGICLEVRMPLRAGVWAVLNGHRIEAPLVDLLAGARSGLLEGLESTAWRLHRAPLPSEWQTRVELPESLARGDSIYVRVRQANDQWAWSSPVFCR